MDAAASRSEIWTRKLLYPAHTLPTALAPVMAAVGLAIHEGVLGLWPAFLFLLAAWLIQFGGVVADNHANLVRRPHDREHPELVDALARGVLTLRGLQLTYLACYLLAVLIGLYLTMIAGWPVVVGGFLAILASWAYSSGPWPIGEHGLGDPLFFLFFGVVSVVGAYFVQAAPALGMAEALPLSAFAISLPIGALITGILSIDDMRDRDFDVEKGKRTVAVRFGKAASRTEFALLLVFSYLVPAWFWLGLELGYGSLLPLLSLPLALSLAREVFRRDSFAELIPMTPRAAQLVMLYAGLLGLGLALPF